MINNNWVFGTQAGLDFSNATATTPPTPTSGYSINTGEGCASISDDNGNLLFYTDGRNIWDANNVVRASNLLGDSSSTQSSIIVPNPGNSDEYYVFTMDGSSNSAPPFNHFNGVLVNITNWNITPISNLFTLPSNDKRSPAEKLTAVQHDNCTDFWVITGLQIGADGTTQGSGVDLGQGVLRVFSVTATGIAYVGETILPRGTNFHEWGYLRSSPDGSRLAIATGMNIGTVLVYPFDNTTGAIDTTNGITIPRPDTAANNPIEGSYGVEFSPDSNLLYFADLTSQKNGNIFQVDLNAATPSALQIATVPRLGQRYAVAALQLGPDGNIYFARDQSTILGVIQSPNMLTGYTVNMNYVTLKQGSNVNLGLPNLLPNACEDPCNCGCNDCSGCNEDAEAQNQELIERAQDKFNVIPSDPDCPNPFQDDCDGRTAVTTGTNFTPCFYFHWGDGKSDQIEEHDTEVFYLTVCNPFEDVRYEGMRITKVTLIPDVHPIEKIHIVPDRFISLDCLEPCSCQTREFALITRANDTAGNYTLEVDYCYEGISLSSSAGSGKVSFPVEITED